VAYFYKDILDISTEVTFF